MLRTLNQVLKLPTKTHWSSSPLRRFSIMENSIRPDFKALPLFQLREFAALDKKKREESLIRLRDTCQQIGFFYLEHDGMSEIIKQMLKMSKMLFDLPQHEKDKVQIANSPHYRGYGKFGAEMTDGIPDRKETFDLGLEQPARKNLIQPYYILQGPNQWPTANALTQVQWKQVVLNYISTMQTVGEQLISAMAIAFELPGNDLQNLFCSRSDDAFAMLRLLHYPPGGSVGEHVDAGGLNILLQDQTGGLQVQNCQGKWIDVTPLPQTVVINFGKTFQLCSNNKVQATPHRVNNTSNNVRHSVAFFLEPRLNAQFLVNNKQVVYGEEIFDIFRRSFPSPTEAIKPRIS